MKRIANSIKIALVIALLPAFVMMGCKNTVDTPEFETLKTYLVDNNMDLPDMLDGWITTAGAVIDSATWTVPGYHVIDIRSAADFSAGRIDGAINVPLTDVLIEAQNATNPILVVCYSGQTAGHAVVALRLNGYADAKVLKWGMSGWHADFDKWTSKCASPAVGDANWTSDPVAANGSFEDPKIETGMTDAEDILADKTTALLAGGLRGVAGTDVLANPGNFFINNYWAEADVAQYGHIAGAYRINPLTLADLNTLDPDAEVVTYCWTGQTSSMITAWLNVLGYNSKSLKNGANSLIHSELLGHKWTASADYPYIHD